MVKKIGKALVIGAGIGGIRSALDLAETGHQVILIDRAAHLGGVLSQLDHQFPSNHCGMCKMLPLLERDAGSQFCMRKGLFHKNIEILTATQLSHLSGEPGNFTVRLRKTSHWVDEKLCVGCGLCATVCPVSVSNGFNADLGTHKAIYLPVPHAVPSHYVIDTAHCTRCGACQKVCPTQAITLADDRRNAFGILVVDDELVVRDSLKEWLVTEGFANVDMAASGPEALKMLTQKPYCLMLTDIKMPGMDGVELLHLAKETIPELTVVMMTAYATVETAVEAMKKGAMDYFMKPFELDVMFPMVERIYQQFLAAYDRTETVHAVIVATGSDYFEPATDTNPYGFGQSPHVVTSLQFERLLSNSGPTNGRLVRPKDGKPIRKIAWMQCVGSRDLKLQADYCSTVCCMYAIKEAMLAKEKSNGSIDTTIYYMDLRTNGKAFQRYRDRAAHDMGIRFERARIHSIASHGSSQDPMIRVAHLDGRITEETMDLVVLAVGQRPTKGMDQLAQDLDLELNSQGFVVHQPFALTRSSRPGIFLSGSAGGLQGIRETLLYASAGALEAGRVIHNTGGRLQPVSEPVKVSEAVLNEPPQTLVVICQCDGRLNKIVLPEQIKQELYRDPAVKEVILTDKLCTADGWAQLSASMAQSHSNRLLIGACHPYLFISKLRTLAIETALPARMMDVADLQQNTQPQDVPFEEGGDYAQRILSALGKSLAGLKHVDPEVLPELSVTKRALVVGGGMAGMHAALGIADMGLEVNLVEKSDRLGGNCTWLQSTLEGHKVTPFLADTVNAVEKHSLITLHLNTQVTNFYGQAGNFKSTLAKVMTDQTPNESVNISYGAVVLATGGKEAQSDQYGYGTHKAIVTQKELEGQIADNALDIEKLGTVVMIQCVGSREEPRNYCSRVCCPAALKQALYIKHVNPEISIYILYRDMMTTGFSEAYYTQARMAGVIFIAYDPADKPMVLSSDGTPSVQIRDPILNATLCIRTDLIVLAVGLSPTPADDLKKLLQIKSDQDGFYQEAESKWRPLDQIKEGIFACGLSLAPCTIAEAVADGQAAAQRALRILTRSRLPADTVTAMVRHSLCALCRRCIDSCPYQARWLDEENQQVNVTVGLCQGCGLCAAVCPNGAAVLKGFEKRQVLEMIDSVFVS